MGAELSCSTSRPNQEVLDQLNIKSQTLDTVTLEKEEALRALNNLSAREKALLDEIEKLKREREPLELEVKKLQAENQALNDELGKLRAELDNKNLEIGELNKAKATKSVADRLKGILAEKGQVDAVNELQRQMEEQDKLMRADKLRIAELEAKMDEIMAERDRLRGAKENLEQQLKRAVDNSSTSVVEMEANRQKLEAKLAAALRDLENAKLKIDDMNNKLSQMTDLQIKLKGLQLENENMSQQLAHTNLILGRDVHRELAELYYVRAKIVGARSLPLPDNQRIRRPYATFNIQDKLKKTKVVQNSTNPDWNEEFVFFLEKKPKNFKVMIFDYDESREDASYDQLGSCAEPLTNYFTAEADMKGSSQPQGFTGNIKLDPGAYANQYPQGAGPVVVIDYECRVVPQVVVRWMTGYQDDHDKIARLLTYVSCDVNEFDKSGRTSLMNAAIRDQPDAATIFIRAGASVDAPDHADSKLTALMYASIYGNARTANVLLNKGKALIESRDALHRTPLMLAAQNGRVAVAELLLSYNAQLEAVYQGGSTALMLAAAEGHTAMVDCLVRHRANLEAKNTMGMTALALTAMRDISDVTRCLVQARAVLETRDTNGLTPLMIAALRGQCNVINVLIDGGCQLEAQDPNGRTAMMYAGFQGQLEVIKLLAMRGASLDVTDHNDQKASAIAKQSSRHDAHELLKQLENPDNVMKLRQNPNAFGPPPPMQQQQLQPSRSQTNMFNGNGRQDLSRSASAQSVQSNRR